MVFAELVIEFVEIDSLHCLEVEHVLGYVKKAANLLKVIAPRMLLLLSLPLKDRYLTEYLLPVDDLFAGFVHYPRPHEPNPHLDAAFVGRDISSRPV